MEGRSPAGDIRVGRLGELTGQAELNQERELGAFAVDHMLEVFAVTVEDEEVGVNGFGVVGTVAEEEEPAAGFRAAVASSRAAVTHDVGFVNDGAEGAEGGWIVEDLDHLVQRTGLDFEDQADLFIGRLTQEGLAGGTAGQERGDLGMVGVFLEEPVQRLSGQSQARTGRKVQLVNAQEVDLTRRKFLGGQSQGG